MTALVLTLESPKAMAVSAMAFFKILSVNVAFGLLLCYSWGIGTGGNCAERLGNLMRDTGEEKVTV